MVDFVDEQRDGYGVEPIRKVLPIAPSAYYEQKARQADPKHLPPRIRHDAVLRDEIESSVGSVGSSYDNALAETIIGLFKTEVIRPRGPWRNLEHVEFADPRVGGLVQQPPIAGADWQHPTC